MEIVLMASFTLNRKNGEPYYGGNEESKDLVPVQELDQDNNGLIDSTENTLAPVQTSVVDVNGDGQIDDNEFDNLVSGNIIPREPEPTFELPWHKQKPEAEELDQIYDELPPTKTTDDVTDVYHSNPVNVGQLDSADSAVDQLTNDEHRGVEAHFGDAPNIKLPEINGSPLQLNGSAGSNNDYTLSKTPISWDNTKDIIQKIAGIPNGIVGSTTIDGIQTDDFNPEVENPSYSTGDELELPDTGEATSTTGPEGPATKMFHDIMAGKSLTKPFEGPNTPNKVGGKKQSSLVKSAQHKSSSEQKSVGTPLKLVGKNSITQGKEDIYERIIDKVQKNYQSWPLASDGESRVKEKGVVAVYARKDWISVKYGSYRRTLLDTFAQEHPQFLPQILEVVQS